MEALDIDPWIGHEFGAYRTVRRIGNGGFARVYEAEGPDGRRCALKVDTKGDPERLAREYRALCAVSHPGIVEPIEFGRQGGTGPAYLVERLVVGVDYNRWVLNRAAQVDAGACIVPPLEVLDQAEQVAVALAAMHAAGWLHRDVTPRNVLREGDRAVLVDLGIARPMGSPEPEDDLTCDGVPIGAPRYMPPEQWTSPQQLTPAADFYALGGLAYFLLCGEAPFGTRGSVQSRFPVGGSSGRRLPSPMTELLAQLTARDPSARPQDLDQVLAAIARCRRQLEGTTASTAGAAEAAETTQAHKLVFGPHKANGGIMTTDQVEPRATLADIIRGGGALERSLNGQAYALRGGHLFVLERGQRQRLDIVPELHFGVLAGAQVELVDGALRISRCPSWLTVVAEENEKAVREVYRPLEPCLIAAGASVNLQLSGPRGDPHYVCGVQHVDEMVVDGARIGAFAGFRLTFSRSDQTDAFVELVVAAVEAID